VIYILVPTFARIEETKKFLNSIHQSIEKDYLILIIDDHPENITFKSIQQNNQVKVFSSTKELWWVGSVNLGIQKLFDKYDLNEEDVVVFANNDIQNR
jgi:Predicted glycosyltransferases